MRRNRFYTYIFNLLFIEISYVMFIKIFLKILKPNKLKITEIYLKKIFLICRCKIYFIEKYIYI